MATLYGLSGILGPPSDVTPAELAARDERAKQDAPRLAAARIKHFHDLWHAIHTLEDPTPEKLSRIEQLIPCGECKSHWKEMLVETPPDLSSLQAYRIWTWARHNAINARLSKPPFPYPDAAAKYGWPTP